MVMNIRIQSHGYCRSCKMGDKDLETHMNSGELITECTDCVEWRKGLAATVLDKQVGS